MSKRIYKYSVQPDMFSEIDLPDGAQIVEFQEQSDVFQIWAIVEPEAKTEKRTFTILGTGWDIPEGYEYVKTCFSSWLVWHLFEKK